MQVIYRPFFFNVSPINTNFQISSLADFCFLSINSGFPQEIPLHSFETEHGRVCAWPWEEEPNIKVQPLTMPQMIFCELKSSLTQLWICGRGCWSFFLPVFYLFDPVREIGCQDMSH